ncbi:DUF3147 family protein [Inhella gelatinilytica]|uniref:DUF3147 family protein n=1 Tax=Inhella gelatinilytica TaxID=2795030 RepID=A0A931IRD1_9BURK|nr:DUF3147 family protein [Inhella gelatinilytica]MBH9551272.1 DUF3147 family protein [Inhella gelatinilytica]
MVWLITKYALTAALVVVIGEAVRRSDKLGGLIGALPWVTVLALIWMHVEGQSTEKLARHAEYTLWYVLPTLPMFVAFPWLLPRWGFWPALAASAAVGLLGFVLFALGLRRWGIELW